MAEIAKQLIGVAGLAILRDYWSQPLNNLASLYIGRENGAESRAQHGSAKIDRIKIDTDSDNPDFGGVWACAAIRATGRAEMDYLVT
jgi:hypothetical protein